MEAAEEPDRHRQRSLLDRAKALASSKRLEGMIKLARSEPGGLTPPDAWDRDPYVPNLLHGVIDLRTGLLREHRPADVMARCTPVSFDPAAPCSRWREFLARILPEHGKREFFQRAGGHSLTGLTIEHGCLFILWGGGANGKTTALKVLRHLLGNYAVKASFEAFLHKRSAAIPNDIARFAGARLIIATEGPEGRHLNESLVHRGSPPRLYRRGSRSLTNPVVHRGNS